jgi:hypothetical protein
MATAIEPFDYPLFALQHHGKVLCANSKYIDLCSVALLDEYSSTSAVSSAVSTASPASPWMAATNSAAWQHPSAPSTDASSSTAAAQPVASTKPLSWKQKLKQAENKKHEDKK